MLQDRTTIAYKISVKNKSLTDSSAERWAECMLIEDGQATRATKVRSLQGELDPGTLCLRLCLAFKQTTQTWGKLKLLSPSESYCTFKECTKQTRRQAYKVTSYQSKSLELARWSR